MPVGQTTLVAYPTVLFQEADSLDRYSVNAKLVPEPSDRCTTTMELLGSVTPVLRFWIMVSFQLVIVPR